MNQLNALSKCVEYHADDQVENLTVGDRIKLGALTGTVHTIGPEFIGIKWDDKGMVRTLHACGVGAVQFPQWQGAMTIFGYAGIMCCKNGKSE
jgi:hypothetical protein